MSLVKSQSLSKNAFILDFQSPTLKALFHQPTFLPLFSHQTKHPSPNLCLRMSAAAPDESSAPVEASPTKSESAAPALAASVTSQAESAAPAEKAALTASAAPAEGAAPALEAQLEKAPLTAEEAEILAQLEKDSFTPKTGSLLYTRKAYWDLRFKEEEKYEWLVEWKDIAGLVSALLAPGSHVLLVGNGTSLLPLHMQEAGFKTLATDYSEVLVARMQAKQPEVAWAVADMMNLPFPAGSFDAVLDKAVFDAILAQRGDTWDPPEDLLATAKTLLQESLRVLKPGGHYVQISFAQPHFRKQYLQQQLVQEGEEGGSWESSWEDFQVASIPAGFGYFMYSMKAKKK